MVYQTIPKLIKKPILPVAILSATFLLTLANTADAFNAQDGMIKNNGFAHSGKNTNTDNAISTWLTIGKGILKGYVWLRHLDLHKLSIDLFINIYQFLTNYILATPMFIFNNAAVTSQVATFSGVSMFIVTLLTMYQGIKKITKQTKSKEEKWLRFSIGDTNIFKRYLVAMGVSGAIPFLFELGFKVINKLIQLISQFGASDMHDFNLFSTIPMTGGELGWLDTLLFLLFDGVLLGLLIPVCLQAGRRWFNLMCLTGIAPLSMTAWIFDDTKHFFHIWWNNVKKLAQSQLVVAFFIAVMGMFIFGTTITGGNAFPALLMIIGGFYSLLSPPTFVKSRMDHGQTTEELGLSAWDKTKDLYDTLTLKNVRTLGFAKKKRAEKLAKIAKLRQKHGQRYVKNLL